MALKAELEQRVLGIIDRIERGARQPDEDTYEELKAKWPEKPYEAARQLAGHANAARGEPILWLIGLHLRQGVCGASDEEFSAWYAQVKKYFDDKAPHPDVHCNVHVGSLTVVAILWDTSEPPYVVQIPRNSQEDLGPVKSDVPYRTATAAYSATRQDLLRILVPVMRRPSYEVMGAVFSQGHNSGHPYVSLVLTFYVSSRSAEPIILPFHKARVDIGVPGLDDRIQLGDITLAPAVRFGRYEPHTFSATAKESASEVTIERAAKISLRAQADVNLLSFREQPLSVRASIEAIFTDHPVTIEAVLTPNKREPHTAETAAWSVGDWR